MPTVLWDVDDVLNDLTAAWLRTVWAPSHPERPIAYRDIRANPPHDVLGISLGEYLESLDGFRRSDAYSSMAPNASILAWLDANGGRCHHVALTATAFVAAPSTASWVLRHFGRWIRGFAFVPASRPGEELPRFDRDKSDWIARHPRPLALVDDAPENLEAARRIGATAITWPQPWNGGATSPDDALGVLDAWLASRAAA